MKKRCYEIFGKKLLICYNESEEITFLLKELELYKEFDQQVDYDLEIHYLGRGEIISEDKLSVNPSINASLEDGMIIKYGIASIQYRFNGGEIEKIEFKLSISDSLKSKVGKLKNIQFGRDGIENLGQIFHELIIVPMTMFFEDYSLVHASGIMTDKGPVLFGGTGGVGKTSLELELCKRKNVKFLADDIVPVSKNGTVFPNMAFPKIYAYNVQGNKELRKELFRNRMSINYMNWILRKKLLGLDMARRRVSPKVFYGNYSTEVQKISSFCLLYRCECKDLELVEATSKDIAELNTFVMQSEYSNFFNHVIWNTYNRRLEGRTAILTIELFQKRNSINLLEALKGVKVYILKVPFSIKHSDFKRGSCRLLEDKGII